MIHICRKESQLTFFFAIQCLAFLGGDAMGQVRLMEMEGDIKASGKIAVGRDFASPEVVGVDVISANGGFRGIATGDGLPSEGEAYIIRGQDTFLSSAARNQN